MLEIAEVKLSSCRLEVADFRKNCNCEVAVRNKIPLKVAELRLRKFFLQVAELRLRTPKKVARAHLWLKLPYTVLVQNLQYLSYLYFFEVKLDDKMLTVELQRLTLRYSMFSKLRTVSGYSPLSAQSLF
jgi:hypothetical protein